MRSRPLFVTVSICILALVAANVAMVPWSRRLPWYRKLESIRAAKDPNVVFIDSSLLDARVDAAALDRGGATGKVSLRPVNAALGAAGPQDQNLLMEYATQLHPGIRTLVVGFMDFQMTNEIRVHAIDLTGNHMVAVDSRFPISEVAPLYDFGRADQAELQLLRWVPVAANRKNAWKYIELLRRSMSDVGLPQEATNSMGRVADFAGLEADSMETFDREAEQFLQNPSHFNTSFERIFDEARQHNLKVFLVLMPASPGHRERFYTRASWSAYKSKLQALSQQRGFTFVDASDWLPEQSQFMDALHMTLPSASDFSYRLGRELAGVPQ